MAGRPLRRTGIPSGNGPAGSMPRIQCRRFIESKGRNCQGRAEPGAQFCRFHGGTSPTHQVSADEMVTDYKDQILELGQAALDKLVQKLESPNESVQLRAALEILDRANVSGTRKSEVTTTVNQRSELDARIEELLTRTPPSGAGLGLSNSSISNAEDDDADINDGV